MRGWRIHALVALLVLASAGCLGGEEASTEAGASQSDDGTSPGGPSEPQGELGPEANATEPKAPEHAEPPWPPATVDQTGCAQYHIFYPTPWESWAGSVPEGFGPDGSDPEGLTTTGYQHLSVCQMTDPRDPAATVEITELWFGVSVTPPEELADPEAVLHLIPAEIIVQGDALAEVYEAWGFGPVLRTGEITWTDTVLPAGRVGQVEAVTDSGTYTLHTQVGPPDVGSVGGSDRLFAVQDGQVTGWFDYAWPGWTDIGTGAVTFTAEGDGEAPPAYPGNVHQVADTDVASTHSLAPGPG